MIWKPGPRLLLSLAMMTTASVAMADDPELPPIPDPGEDVLPDPGGADDHDHDHDHDHDDDEDGDFPDLPPIDDPDQPELPPIEDPNPPVDPSILTVDQSQYFRPIPDGLPRGIEIPLNVVGNGRIASVGVLVKLDHVRPRDLFVDLVHPDGTRIPLHRGADVRPGYFELNFGTGGQAYAALDTLRGKSAAGTWRILAADNRPFAVGNLHGVVLKVSLQNQ